MSRAMLVAQREYLENIKTKGFWFSTLFMPIVFGAAMIVPIWFESNKDTKVYAVLDQSGWLGAAVERQVLREDMAALLAHVSRLGKKEQTTFPDPVQQLAALWKEAGDKEASETDAQSAGESAREQLLDIICGDEKGGALNAHLEIQQKAASHSEAVISWWKELPYKEARKLVPESTKRHFAQVQISTDATPESLNQQILDEEIFAYFIIGDNPEQDSAGCRYASANLTDTALQDWFAGLASEEVRRKRLDSRDIQEEVAAWIASELDFQGRLISIEGDEEANEKDAVAQWAPVAFVYLLWLSVFMVAMMMLTSTVTEKSNRLVEVLLSSISAMELMAGKIIGIAATGLTTVGTWLISFLALVHFLPVLLGAQPDFSLAEIASQPIYLVSFVVYFTLGYLFYGALLVGLGSVCDNLKDAQNMASPVTLLLFVPMMLMVPIGQDPNGTFAKIFSYIPPLTPFVMMNRAAGPPSPMEYVLTTILMIISVIFALWAAAKIFRVGILLSGKPPKLKELWRFIKMPT